MVRIPVPPQHLICRVGGAFEAVGREWFNVFTKYCGLEPHERVLDIGCGCGRMAIPLANYLNHEAVYEGFDCDRDHVQWCKTNISSVCPNFRFMHIDVKNEFYNPRGTLSGATINFPCPDSSFDFIILASVFTHVGPDVLKRYLAEIGRVLCFGKRFVASCFLDAANSGSDSRRHYTEEFVRHEYLLQDFAITAVHYGHWKRKEQTPRYQDLVIATKRG